MKRLDTSRNQGFTRIEAFALIISVLLLGMLSFPSAANARGTSKSALCMSNLRHLVFAWQLYAHDNYGLLVGNYTGGEAMGVPTPLKAPWATGWLDWTTATDNTNVMRLRDPRFARLADYILTADNVHKCPADNFQSGPQRSRGMERVRSVAMNSTVGPGNAMTGPSDPLYRQAIKLSDLYLPSPAETTVISDEHPDSINDPMLYSPRKDSWIDIPGNFHGGAGSFSFGDGHVALRQWRTTGIRNLRVRYNLAAPRVTLGDPDITWMNFSSQRKRNETF